MKKRIVMFMKNTQSSVPRLCQNSILFPLNLFICSIGTCFVRVNRSINKYCSFPHPCDEGGIQEGQ